MVKQFFDTMIVASSDNEWLKRPIKIQVLETASNYLNVIEEPKVLSTVSRVKPRIEFGHFS